MENRYENTNFGQRLAHLYSLSDIDINQRGWATNTAVEMLKLDSPGLDKGRDSKAISTCAHALKAHLSVETSDKVSGIWLSRYCNFFGCSADYLMGYIDGPTAVGTDIASVTGLSDRAVRGLIWANDIHKHPDRKNKGNMETAEILPTINYLLEGLSSGAFMYMRLFFVGLSYWIKHPSVKLKGTITDQFGKDISEQELINLSRRYYKDNSVRFLSDYIDRK